MTSAPTAGQSARPHINVDGKFQSDKYPTCPAGKVPLSVTDPSAQDLLWEYAQRRRPVDAQFSDDLEFALTNAGFHRVTASEGDVETAQELIDVIKGEIDEATWMYDAWDNKQREQVVAVVVPIIAAFRAHVREQSQQRWEPITSAPQNEEILYEAICPRYGDVFYGSMKWREREGEEPHWWDDSSTMRVENPRRWCRLPSRENENGK